MRICALLIVMLAAALVHAGPEDFDRAEVRPLVTKGRKLAADNKLAEARAAYEAELKLVPDDPLALAESAGSEYRAKELKTAEATTRLAIAHAKTADVRGAALFNLGHMQEDAGDKPGAIVSYSESLRARRSGAVRLQLATLDAAAAAVFDPFAPARMHGPFPTIEAFYKTVQVAPNAAIPDVCDLEVLGVASAKQLAPPYQAIELTHRRCDDLTMRVAVKLADGWYFGELEPTEIAVSPVASALHCGTVPVTVTDVTIEKLAGGQIREHVAYTTTGRCNHKNIDFGWDERSVIVVGVGTSGAPFATPPIVSRLVESDDLSSCMDGPCHAGKGTLTDLDFKASWKPDGSLVIDGKKTRGLAADQRTDLVGTHVIAFP